MKAQRRFETMALKTLAQATLLALAACAGGEAGEAADAADAESISDGGVDDAAQLDAGPSDASPADGGGDADPGPDTGNGTSTSDAGADGLESDAGDASLTEVAASFGAELETHSELLCTCYELYGHESQQDCLDPDMAVDLDDNACAEQAFALDEASSLTFLQCATRAAKKLTECLDEDPDCGEETFQQTGSCSMTYAFSYEACGVLPMPVEEALADCGILGF